jgi:HSP20 family molecular chaperone IbpA
MEIAYSRFERQVELPGDLQRAKIDTEFRDGMLLVRIQREADA